MASSISTDEKARLCNAARKVAEAAYAPYSKFRVGAAILGEKGMHTAVNVENASFGLSLCAERAALAKAISEGENVIRAIAVACVDATPGQSSNEILPCGACRQWMIELAMDAAIVICDVDGQSHDFALTELMPLPFRLNIR
jgi:cytidine deaminase